MAHELYNHFAPSHEAKPLPDAGKIAIAGAFRKIGINVAGSQSCASHDGEPAHTGVSIGSMPASKSESNSESKSESKSESQSKSKSESKSVVPDSVSEEEAQN